MNKGRNIFLLLVCLLCISVLAFFTLFQRSNTSGVVDDIRYVLDSDEDGVKIYSFYFIKEESVKATVTDDAESWYIKVENCIYNYRVQKEAVK